MARERFVDTCLAALLAQAGKLISDEFHAVVPARGRPVAESRILASLAGGEGLPAGRLAQLVLAPQPTLTRQPDRMLAKGLVQRIAHASDRRLTLARITPGGLALAKGLLELAPAHERRVLAPFGRERAMLLKAVLAEMIAQHQRPAAQARRLLVPHHASR